eukprot:38468-Rhodomonas_salina.6
MRDMDSTAATIELRHWYTESRLDACPSQNASKSPAQPESKDHTPCFEPRTRLRVSDTALRNVSTKTCIADTWRDKYRRLVCGLCWLSGRGRSANGRSGGTAGEGSSTVKVGSEKE